MVPVGWAGKVARPERPGTALAGADRINCASFLAVFLFQKNAVFVNRLLDNGRLEAEPFGVFSPDVLDRHFQKLGQKLQFLLINPDNAFVRAAAAVAAAGAFKVQSAYIP